MSPKETSVELYSSILNPRGPNYERLKGIFGDNRVPLKSPHAVKAQLGDEQDVPVYLLDLGALPLNQRARLFAIIAQKCGVTISKVEEVMAQDGFPIREADVIVSFDMRACV
jgi:hypothetical protein